MIDEVYKLLVEKTKSTPGAKVENNKFCLSVHFRCVDEKVYIYIYQPWAFAFYAFCLRCNNDLTKQNP